jgi:hypothetical protein
MGRAKGKAGTKGQKSSHRKAVVSREAAAFLAVNFESDKLLATFAKSFKFWTDYLKSRQINNQSGLLLYFFTLESPYFYSSAVPSFSPSSVTSIVTHTLRGE